MSEISFPPVHSALQEHSKMFENPRIIKVTEHVYVGVNFAIANMIMVEGMNNINLKTDTGIGFVPVLLIFKPISGSVDKMFSTKTGNSNLISVRVKPKTVKIITHSFLVRQPIVTM